VCKFPNKIVPKKRRPRVADFSHVPAAWRFVGGRRHYNRTRRRAAEERRRRLIDLYCQLDGQGQRVTQRQLAEALGVHESTVSRDCARFNNGFGWRMRVSWGRALGKW
jgi:hypothetical protein